MANDDWFRSASWDEATQSLFWQKLARARNKAAYTQIKALSLQETRDHEKVTAAIGLLKYFLAEWPDDWHTSIVLDQLAQCSIIQGHFDDALQFYEEAFASERKRPNLKTRAVFNYGWLIICRPFPSHYEKAMSILDEFYDFSPFPVDTYLASTIRAVSLNRLGREPRRAAELAATALAAARMTQAPLRYHSNLGLVTHVDADIHRELESIVSSAADA